MKDEKELEELISAFLLLNSSFVKSPAPLFVQVRE
jgi:hypothetical protein